MKQLILTFLLWYPLWLFAEHIETTPAKKMLCAACHGEQGVSANPVWPNLAGQHSTYLLKQLQDFKQGSRSNALMLGIVAGLTEQEMQELALFYNNQSFFQEETIPKSTQRGEALYRTGDFKKKITACITCHGPKGLGNKEAGFPLLVGQHATYIIEQLLAFKDKKRSNDLHAIMQDISARMNDEDIEAVALYIQGLHP